MANVDPAELERYEKLWQANPDSRVFAPLADLYRRMGRLREAESLVREGLRRHPFYAGAKVALSHVLLDLGKLDEALREAEAVVTYYPDNLLARKLLIRAFSGLSRIQEAQREYEALKALAPLVASDPELELALQGPQSTQKFPSRPVPLQAGLSQDPRMPLERPQSVSSQRSLKLSKLLRKKIILESLIQEINAQR